MFSVLHAVGCCPQIVHVQGLSWNGDWRRKEVVGWISQQPRGADRCLARRPRSHRSKHRRRDGSHGSRAREAGCQSPVLSERGLSRLFAGRAGEPPSSPSVREGAAVDDRVPHLREGVFGAARDRLSRSARFGRSDLAHVALLGRRERDSRHRSHSGGEQGHRAPLAGTGRGALPSCEQLPDDRTPGRPSPVG